MSLAESVVDAASRFVKVPKDNPDALAAGAGLAKTAKTLVETINTVLLPIAALNFGVAKAKIYFETQFQKELGEKLQEVPLRNVMEPKPSLVAPALHRLSLAVDEHELKNLYLELIASAMNSEKASSLHPCFVEIVAQLGAEEARYLSAILATTSRFQAATLGIRRMDSLFKPGVSNLLNLRDENGPLRHPDLSLWVDNWIRLGLISVQPDHEPFMFGKWAKTRDEYKELHEAIQEPNTFIEIRGCLLIQTDLGVRFAQSVGISAPRDMDDQAGEAHFNPAKA